MMRLAGIDIGTLTCRLLVADVQLSHTFKELAADRRILRLGEGVDEHKWLAPQAMDRVLATLKEWRTQTAKYDLDGLVIVATSAVRESSNRQEFLTQVKQETGWDVEVLTGEEEARRTLLGIRVGLPDTIADFLGLDIGGGSTECILDRKGQSPNVVSLDLGVVRLLERVFHHDPPTMQDIGNAEAYIDEQLAIVKEAFGQMPNIPLVGTAGTVTTLAAMAQSLAFAARRRRPQRTTRRRARGPAERRSPAPRGRCRWRPARGSPARPRLQGRTCPASTRRTRTGCGRSQWAW